MEKAEVMQAAFASISTSKDLQELQNTREGLEQGRCTLGRGLGQRIPELRGHR